MVDSRLLGLGYGNGQTHPTLVNRLNTPSDN